MLALLMFAGAAMAQVPGPLYYTSGSGSCIYSDSAANSYILTDVTVLTPPRYGTVTTSTPNGAFIYCPTNINQSGGDTMRVYGCVSGNIITFPTCDTFDVIISIYPNCNLQVALVVDSVTVCANVNYAYQAVVTGGNAPYLYNWSSGATGSSACEVAPGQQLCLTVTDASGCAGNICSNQNGCNLYVSIVPGICGGPLPSLLANATGGTAPYTYVWNNNNTGPTVCNLSPGTYCVAVLDAAGCSVTNCSTVTGTGGCAFNYTIAANPGPSNVVAFMGYVDTTYTPTAWLWSFGDPLDPRTDTAQNPTHVYQVTGQVNVTMQVWYSNGDSCIYSKDLYIFDDSLNTIQCQANFNSYIDNSGVFHFIDYSAYAPSTWQWDFGDGTGSTQANPTHNYNSNGSWNVCLTTTDASGCTSSYCQQVTNVPVQDVAAYLYHQTTVTPGFPVWVNLGYYNAGTVLMNGTVVYRYPAGTTVNATSVTPAQHDVANRLLTFNYSSLVPGTSDYIYIDLTADPSLVLGTLANDTVWINPVAGDANPSDNIAVVADSVVGSWDPNDKAVSPKGEGSQGIVPMATKELSYRIRFQNTGTAPARTVKIRDIISNSIDLSSLKVTGASHAHTTEIIGNELVVTFANINLVDSGTDYEASQGFIDVHVKLKPGLNLGTQIFNTAGIYFDFNAPVITNTVVTTLGSLVAGIESTVKFDFAVMPNPASNQVLLRGDFEKASAYELMDQLGQVVLSGPITSSTPLININSLNSGVYLVRVKSGIKAGVQRLVIAR